MNIINELINEFDEKIKIIDNERYIPYEYLSKVFDFFVNNKNEVDNNKELSKELSTRLLSILTNLTFTNNTTNSLKQGQMTYNGVGSFEHQLHSQYSTNLKYLGGNEFDHEYMHTGKGFGIPDFEVIDTFNLMTINNTKISVPIGYKIDAKTYFSKENMLEHVQKNVNGSLGHDIGNKNNVYLLYYIMNSDKYYFGPNRNTEPVEIKSLELNFNRPFVQLNINDDGILNVKYFNF